MPAVLFVCLGNICRSPAAETILTHFAKQEYPEEYIHVKSCGTSDWHIGELPDVRMQKALKKRGYKTWTHAIQFQTNFFDSFDYILASDHEIMKELLQLAKEKQQREKVQLATAFSSKYQDQIIPDPYYGTEENFDEVITMLEVICQDILKQLFNK